MIGALLDRAAGWEVDWTSAVGAWPRPVGVVLEVLMQAGSRWPALILAALLVGLGRVRQGLALFAAGLSAWLLARVLKRVVERPRPTPAQFGRPLREVADGFSFPSSHAALATAAVLALLLTTTLPARWRTAAWAAGGTIVLATCLGRMYVGAHWPLDLLGGIAIGAICAWPTALVATRVR